jgi:hypothetical protein
MRPSLTHQQPASYHMMEPHNGLASDHDGEVVATARAIGRLLKSTGHDWHDLAASLRLPVTQNQDADWRLVARFCADHAALLNKRELDFIANIADARWNLTDKQLKWLHAIAHRVRGGAA